MKICTRILGLEEVLQNDAGTGSGALAVQYRPIIL